MNERDHPPKTGLESSLFSSSGNSATAAGSDALPSPRVPGCLGRVERFDLLQILGQGGMGVVYLAREIPGVPASLGDLVALKTLRGELTASHQAVRHFRKEAKFQQQLQHPHILPVLETGGSRSLPHFIMPFVPQGSLARLIRSSGPLARADCLRIARQICSALRYAHERGIIHRDLKPANILLESNGDAKVADFGLALTLFNDPLLDLGRLRPQGTAPYWSPAVAQGKAEDTRCDIYSFGALLYEMLTGRPPYQGASVEEIVAQIVSGPPPPILEISPDADEGLVRIAQGAMGRELRNRYTDAGALAADLERVAQGQKPLEPAGQGPPTASRAIKPFKLAAFAALALLVGFALWHGFNRDQQPSLPSNAATQPDSNGFGLKLVRRFQLPGIWRYDSAKLGDYDGDGRGDLFMMHAGQFLAVSGEGQLLRQTPFFAPQAEDLLLQHLWDIDQDQRHELVVRWRERTNVYGALVNQQFFELKRFRATGSYRQIRSGGDRQYSTMLEPAALVDLEQDGQRELLVRLTTGFELEPRAVVCFSFETAQEVWRHEIAPRPHDIVPMDLDGDGVQEIVFGTSAVGNGHQLEDGTDDNHSYVGLLSSGGRLKWRREVGGHYCYSTPIAAELNGTSGKELIVLATTTHRFKDTEPHHEMGKIIQFSSEGEILGQFDAGHFLWKAHVADLDGDQRDEILATDYLGCLFVLNSDLTLRRKIQISPNPKDYVQLDLCAVRDLDQDGRSEIVLKSCDLEILSEKNVGRDDQPPNAFINHNCSVVVLAADFKEIGRYLVADKSPRGFDLELSPMHSKDSVELFVLADDVKVLRLNP